MNLYSREFLTDDQLVAEIRAHAKAKRELAMGSGVAVIAGEGRRVEFTAGSSTQLGSDLAEMMYEARARGLPIGGMPENAIAVEIG